MTAAEAGGNPFPDIGPGISGLDMYGSTQTATVNGGDYFDCIAHGPGRCTVIIADVSGKGAQAATDVRKVRSVVRSFRPEEPSAVELLRTLQRRISSSLVGSFFVTALAAAFDMKAGSVEIARAGHLPALLMRGGRVRLIDPPGVWIGRALAQSFDIMLRPQAWQLRTGDVLLLYTDGVIQATGQGEELYGIARLENLLLTSKGDARGIVRECFEDLRDFTGPSEQTDDRTIVAVRVTGVRDKL